MVSSTAPMGEGRTDLRVPKKAVAVELTLVDRGAARIELFVAEAQGVAPLLEGDFEFLPGHDVDEDTWVVLRRSSVLWVRLTPEPESLELFDHAQDVRIDLAGGSSLDGSLLYTAAPERARVVDHLNEPGRFLELWQEERLCLVNKAYIVKLRER
jgi:hypothetical protein